MKNESKFSEHRFQISRTLNAIPLQYDSSSDLNDHCNNRPITVNIPWNGNLIGITHIPAVDSNRLLIHSEINSASSPKSLEALRSIMKINHALSENTQASIGFSERDKIVISLALPVEHLDTQSLMYALDCIDKLSLKLSENDDFSNVDDFRLILESHDFLANDDIKQEEAEKKFSSLCNEIKSDPSVDGPYDTESSGLDIGCGSTRVFLSLNTKLPSDVVVNCKLREIKKGASSALINLLKINHVMSFMKGGVFSIDERDSRIVYRWHQDIYSFNAEDLMNSIAEIVRLSNSDYSDINIVINEGVMVI
ncbi:CesT family type III secretion system chaperone [Dyella sp. M7H15-1]|uniref:CesT family type III secretion system chaperone n=1 Tax=Dyella sp. M7H15-1 TaxID=2501295 RepID=UPI0013E8E3C1|nr:CesT family type III secretion system chaperone [Dyella sp. M7H15-1]